jgi:hypothetical protein
MEQLTSAAAAQGSCACAKVTHIVWIPKRHSMAPSLGQLVHCRIALGWGDASRCGSRKYFLCFGGALENNQEITAAKGTFYSQL